MNDHVLRDSRGATWIAHCAQSPVVNEPMNTSTIEPAGRDMRSSVDRVSFALRTVPMKNLPILLLAMILPSELWSQPRKPTAVAEIATYNGPDREQVLYAGAKGEGKIVWYTSLAGDSYKTIARAFEARSEEHT